MITKTVSLKTGELVECTVGENTEEDKGFDDSELINFWVDKFIQSKSIEVTT